MLQPDHTVLLTDALRPPSGYRVDTAVATTYSMNLTAILVAPMTFALHDIDDTTAMTNEDPVKVLDAAQKYLSRTTVFCQAGKILIPSSYSQIFEFLEDSIHQVTAPGKDALFHPKIWAVRYQGEDYDFHHRLLIASRNLTLDSARDTLLVLDEDPEGTIDAAPAAQFIGMLPDQTVEPLPTARRDGIADLARTLSSVRFEAPAPFTDGWLAPLGMTTDSVWPFASNPERVLAISPFLAPGTLSRLRAAAENCVLLSRAEEIDRLGARALDGWDIHVLSSSLDLDADQVSSSVDEYMAVPGDPEEPTDTITFNGLHAKTVVADLPGHVSITVTGSANLTGSAWSSNVEFDAVLTGPTNTCGIDAVLHDRGESLGLSSVLQPYTPSTQDGEDDPTIATSFELEKFHQQLALSRPRLDIFSGTGTVRARLDLEVPPDAPGSTEVWLVTAASQKRHLDGQPEWEIAPENITPFVAIRTTSGTGDARVTRSCCLLVPLAGDVPDRRQATIASILTGPDRMLRYLAFLLGIRETLHMEVRTEDMESGSEPGSAVDGDPVPVRAPAVVLYEPLVRAVAQSPDHLASIADQIVELRSHPETNELIPDEFQQMWDVVLEVTRERRQR